MSSLSSTRICVKNLPKHLTLDRFRAHFEAKGEVTDAKIITKDGHSRLFGFIGYKTTKDAKAAAQYFSNTFLDTSRIIVEMAKPVGDTQLARPWSKYSKGSSAFEMREKKKEELESKKKRKQFEVEDPKNPKKPAVVDPSEQAKKDSKLAEFLDLTQPRVTKQFWANADGFGQDGPIKKKQKVEVAEKAVTSKKPGGSSVLLKKTHIKFLDDSEGESDEEYQDMKIEEEDKEEVSQERKQDPLVNDPNVSDLAYLRSKVKKPEDDEDESESEEESKEESESEESEGEHSEKETKAEEKSANITEKEEKKEKKENEEANQDDDVGLTGRLFVRNLPFSTNQDELKSLFQQHGLIEDIHIPVFQETQQSKGIAFIQYAVPKNALKAMAALDGKIYQGRLLHVMPGKPAKENQSKVNPNKPMLYKEKKEEERKTKAANSHNWNSLFMRSDAVAEAIAAKLQLPKAEILDRDADNVAVRLALAETTIISETKKYFEEQGVVLEALSQHNNRTVERSNTTILIKNIPHSTEIEDIRILFGNYGEIGRIILPPAKTIALIEYSQSNAAKKAFASLAYTKFKHVPLFLEWAPTGLFKNPLPASQDKGNEIYFEDKTAAPVKLKEAEPEEQETVVGATLYVKNLNFNTTEDAIEKFFRTMGEVRSVTIAKKKDMKNPGKMLSMGYGFVEFKHKEDAIKAMKQLQGKLLDDHALVLKLSSRGGDKNEEDARKGTKDLPQVTKLIIRNLPFEATKKDLRELTRPFGGVKSVRIPKKFDGKSRGFGFIEFTTKQEAANSFEALKSTHLYGRHLVIEYAQEETGIDALREKTARQFEDK